MMASLLLKPKLLRSDAFLKSSGSARGCAIA